MLIRIKAQVNKKNSLSGECYLQWELKLKHQWVIWNIWRGVRERKKNFLTSLCAASRLQSQVIDDF